MQSADERPCVQRHPPRATSEGPSKRTPPRVSYSTCSSHCCCAACSAQTQPAQAAEDGVRHPVRGAWSWLRSTPWHPVLPFWARRTPCLCAGAPSRWRFFVICEIATRSSCSYKLFSVLAGQSEVCVSDQPVFFLHFIETETLVCALSSAPPEPLRFGTQTASCLWLLLYRSKWP